MTKRLLKLLLAATILIQTACLIRAPEVITPWENTLSFSTNTPYRNMNATATGIQLITDDEFVRLDQNGALISRWPISLPFKFFGRPILGDFAIARIVRKEIQGNPVLELRSTKDPDIILDLDFTSLDDGVNAPVLDNIFPEEDSRYSGAFNATSTQLLIPSINFSKNSHTFFLVEIDYGVSGISSAEVSEVIDIPEIPAANGVLSNIKFINGNYYVVSLDGSFIIRPDGTYDQLFQGHFWDFFQLENELYATDRSRLLYSSANNGGNWVVSPDSSNLQQVEIANGEVFSQQALGFRFKLGTDDFSNPVEMIYNPEHPNDFAAYRNIVYVNGYYYMTVQKTLFRSEELLIDEE